MDKGRPGWTKEKHTCEAVRAACKGWRRIGRGEDRSAGIGIGDWLEVSPATAFLEDPSSVCSVWDVGTFYK